MKFSYGLSYLEHFSPNLEGFFSVLESTAKIIITREKTVPHYLFSEILLCVLIPPVILRNETYIFCSPPNEPPINNLFRFFTEGRGEIQGFFIIMGAAMKAQLKIEPLTSGYKLVNFSF
jgi:hypothetical protein